ncbi:MFS transporter [Williamsia sp.]|uniref:MFS transporter n=1 Tax=Williamsia sp. TaxID=1872085 RepID=UPI001A2D6065|nr:MFS transporter [Williamsia sp.]MBJ7290167.1 MFS transporter [Williamsia sp.]
MRDRRALATPALAGALFVYLTAEMFPIGVLPELARDLDTTESRAGSLLSVYAAIAGLAILPAVSIARRWDRRRVVVGSLLLLALSQVALAGAPDLQWALAARAVGAVPHGVLWSVVPAVAASLRPQEPGRATARVFVGGSLALVAGAPAMTALAGWTGWRIAAASVGALALALAAVAALSLPSMPAEARQPPGIRATALSRPIVSICATTVAIVTASYIPYTFLSVLADDVSIRSSGLAGLQIGYGAAGLVAVALIGRLLDTRIRTALALVTGGLVIAFGAIASCSGAVIFVAAVVVWGAAFACAAPTLQTAVLRTDDAHPVVASAMYVLAFQIGIMAGSWSGGAVIDEVGSGWLAACGLGGVIVAGILAIPLFRATNAQTR